MLIDTSTVGLVEVEKGVKVLPPNIIVSTFNKIVNLGKLILALANDLRTRLMRH